MSSAPDADLRATDSLEREVLTTLRDAKAPTQARAQGRDGVAAGMAAVSPAAVSAAASLAPPSVAGSRLALGLHTKALLGTVAKITVFAALSGAALGATAFWANRQGTWKPAPHRGARHAAAAHTLAPGRELSTQALAAARAPSRTSVVQPDDAPSLREAIPAHASTAAAPAARSADKGDPNTRLAEESALLGTARGQLKHGDVVAADASLQHLRSRFPAGALVQERELLEIAVLNARGNTGAAKNAARAFVARHPNSPHSTSLRSWLVEP